MANAKGTVMVEVVKSLRAQKDRARALVPAPLQHYLAERVVVASWYPLEDYLALLRIAGEIQARAGHGPFEEMGRSAARAHMQGTYSRLKNNSSRQASFTLLSSMYDTGKLEVIEREPGRAALEFSGFAIPSREVCETFTGYQAERMTILGFEDVKVRHVKCRAERAPVCRWELTWKGREML